MSNRKSASQKTVLLVDDEPIMLRRLELVVPWDELGYVGVHAAQDGVTALDVLSRIAVDLVITDLVMPRMDGIKLIETIRQSDPDMEFIVLTGHDQFEYARRCLRLGVRDYVLKPIVAEELTKAIYASCRTFGPSRVSESRVDSFLHRDIEKAKEGLSPSASEAVMIISVESPNLHSLILERIPQVCQDSMSRVRVETLRKTSDSVGMLAVGSARDTARFLSLIENAITPLKPGIVHIPHDVFYELSERQIDDIFTRTTYQSRNRRLFRPFDASVRIELSDSIHSSQHYIEPDRVRGLEAHMTAALLRRDHEGVRSTLRELLDLVADSAPDYHVLEYALSDLVLYLSAFTTRGDMSVSPRSVSELLLECVNLEDVHSKVFDLIERHFMPTGVGQNTPATQHVDAAKQYIEEHFAEPGLTLAEIASAASSHPGYLSTLFPQHTGKTVVEYLTDRRLEHAVELMRSGCNRLIDIAELTGYRDPYYFSRCFKRRFGEAPSAVLRRYRN